MGFYEQDELVADLAKRHSKAEFRKETNDRSKLIFTILAELIPYDQEGGRKIGFIETQ